MKRTYSYASQLVEVEMNFQGEPNGEKTAALVTARGGSLSIEILDQRNHRLIFRANGKIHEAYIALDGREVWVAHEGRIFRMEKGAGRRKEGRGKVADERELRAPMPGQVREVLVIEGQPVNAGQTLLILEAMKMEMRIQAHKSAQIKHLLVKTGQTVEKGQILAELED